MMTTMAERAPRERLGLAFAILNGANPVGAFVGPLVGGPVVDALGFPALLEVDVLLMLVVVVTLSLGYRDGFVGTERRPVVRMAIESATLVLTLTGAGGCGKTRLALQVAADAPGVYPHGVWLGELAALSDPALVPHAVASAVGAEANVAGVNTLGAMHAILQGPP
jgi:MFS family permease